MLPYVKEVSPPVPNHFFQIQGRDGLLPVENLDDINKKDMIPHMSYAFTSPSCGLDAFLYVVNELKADIVNIVGMDFYDDIGYLTNSLGNIRNTLPMEEANRKWIEHCNRRGDPTDLMQGFFFNVVKKNPSTKFPNYRLPPPLFHIREKQEGGVVKRYVHSSARPHTAPSPRTDSAWSSAAA